MPGFLSGLGSNDWGSMFGSALGGGSGGSSLIGDFDWGSTLSGIFGGGSSSSSEFDLGSLFNSSNSSDIFKAILGGVGGYATAKIDEKTAKEAGRQQRKTLDFQAQLTDYYKQKDKVRKRAALDTYGQFSLLDRYAPNRTPSGSIDQSNKPALD